VLKIVLDIKKPDIYSHERNNNLRGTIIEQTEH
jgi:hypothetical protein